MTEPERERPELTIVVPVFNERENLDRLVAEIHDALRTVRTYEVILVDDGSDDGSGALIEDLARRDESVAGVLLHKHFGKAEALSAGFEASSGAAVVTIDADLQDRPDEIPKLIEKLREGYDVVSGWRQRREDTWVKTVTSKLFNVVTSALTNVSLHDHNCGLKVYTAEVARDLRPYGELHRFLPVLADNRGFRVTEVPVRHRARAHGKSKYGTRRFLNGILDLLTVVVTVLHGSNPLHVFGPFGLALLGAGFLSGGYLTVLWFLHVRPIGTRPLLTFSVLSVLFGAQLVIFGLLAEIVIRSRQYRPPAARRVGRTSPGSSASEASLGRPVLPR